jgi:hypothetical protein
MFSVPRPSGGYDYYQAPPGVAPPLNNDWPIPNVPHPNDIGLSSLHVGRALPAGSRRVGSGQQAVGSITAMPGAGGAIESLEALGVGRRPASAVQGLGELSMSPPAGAETAVPMILGAALVGFFGYLLWKDS